ncbi:MAG: dipeptidyl-peptidase-4 [Planctomycetota bacterium]
MYKIHIVTPGISPKPDIISRKPPGRLDGPPAGIRPKPAASNVPSDHGPATMKQCLPPSLPSARVHCQLTALAVLLFALFANLGCSSTETLPSTAGQAPPSTGEITLEQIFGGHFAAEGFGPAWWLEDSGLATLEDAAGGQGRNLVRYDPASGKREILVAAQQLVPAGASEPLTIADYRFSADGAQVLIFTNTRRVWRYHTRGDYWVLDRTSGELRQLGQGFEEARLQFAKFDPAGERVAYLYQHDIYVESLADGVITRLTHDGSDTLTNGTFDWLYEEEWGLRDGFRWSPDGQRIAFWQLDAEAVGQFSLVNNTLGLYSQVTPYRYPKVGTTNPTCRIGTLPAAGGEIRWIDLPGHPSDDYVARMEWADNSSELILQRFNRLQNECLVMLADVSTGVARTVFNDRNEAWVEVCDDVKWFDDGQRFTWVSERDGWKHLYFVARDGSSTTLVTPGNFDVVSIQHIDAERGWVYFIASPDDPTQRFLYRARLDGGDGEQPLRITPQQRGTHAYQISPNGDWAIHRYSAFGAPASVELVSLPGHQVLRTMTDNAALKAQLAQLDTGPAEFFRVAVETDESTGEAVELDGWVIRPPDFDPDKRYPVLVYVYGEPAGQTVVDRWGGNNYLWHLLLAQKGYVVLSIDNRGTPGPRGTAWRKSIYGKIGIIAPQDQAAALRALQERWPYLDTSRVGIWGWSGGGSMSLNAIFRYPDLYHTAMAIAFVADQRFYDTAYQERYMGLPKDNPEGFRLGSPITHAQHLRGNLLLVYGSGDDNCHYQNCEMLVDELIRHNKQFEMQIYPNRTHSISQGANTTLHLFTRLTRYLQDNLPAGAR